MNVAGQIIRWYAPDFVRRGALRELFQGTADAFGVSMPAPIHPSSDALLEQYAAFTAEQADARLRDGGDLVAVKQELFNSAYAMGARLRRDLGVTSTADALAVARAVYRMLDVDFHATAAGDVRIPTCYFSRFYSASTCKLISALDQGLLAGLTGGRRLEFRQRITEGAACCLATLAEASP